MRRKAGVKRIDKRRNEELRQDVGESLARKLVRSRLKWAGHVERTEGEELSKRADALRVDVEGRRERGRLRWEDCVTRNLAGVGNEGATV